jgi:hypothetical protein
MLLSHQHLTLYVRSAPNPKDIIWDNVSIPQRQVRTRRMIADVTLIVGAIFWSFVVGFLATISNLEFISKEHGLQWLQDYNNTPIYAFLNNYLTLGLLLVLLLRGQVRVVDDFHFLCAYLNYSLIKIVTLTQW